GGRRQADRGGEPQGSWPVLELAAERALTNGTPMPTERLEQVLDQLRGCGGLAGRLVLRMAAWAAVAGIDVELDSQTSGPYVAMAGRDWRGAGDGFGEAGWRPERALMRPLVGGRGA